MKIHKEGHKIIRNFIIISLIILLFLPYLYLSIFLLSTLMLIVFFFRIPKREIIRSKNTVFAPCDGKIVQIREVEETEFFKQKKITVTNSEPEASLIIKLDIFIFLFLCPFHLASLHHNSSIFFHQRY